MDVTQGKRINMNTTSENVQKRIFSYLRHWGMEADDEGEFSARIVRLKTIRQNDEVAQHILDHIHCYAHEVPVSKAELARVAINEEKDVCYDPMYAIPGTPIPSSKYERLTSLQPWSLGTLLGMLHAAACSRNTWDFWEGQHGGVEDNTAIETHWLNPNTPFDLLLYIAAVWGYYEKNKEVTPRDHPSVLRFPKDQATFEKMVKELYIGVKDPKQKKFIATKNESRRVILPAILVAGIPQEGITPLGFHKAEFRPYKKNPHKLHECYEQYLYGNHTNEPSFYASTEIPMASMWCDASFQTARAFALTAFKQGISIEISETAAKNRVGSFIQVKTPTIIRFTAVKGTGDCVKAGQELTKRKQRALNPKWGEGCVDPFFDTHTSQTCDKLFSWEQFSATRLNPSSANALYHAILGDHFAE